MNPCASTMLYRGARNAKGPAGRADAIVIKLRSLPEKTTKFTRQQNQALQTAQRWRRYTLVAARTQPSHHASIALIPPLVKRLRPAPATRHTCPPWDAIPRLGRRRICRRRDTIAKAAAKSRVFKQHFVIELQPCRGHLAVIRGVSGALHVALASSRDVMTSKRRRPHTARGV